jgi:hypothetical protein
MVYVGSKFYIIIHNIRKRFLRVKENMISYLHIKQDIPSGFSRITQVKRSLSLLFSRRLSQSDFNGLLSGFALLSGFEIKNICLRCSSCNKASGNFNRDPSF